MLPGCFADSGGRVARKYDLWCFDCHRKVLADRSGLLKAEISLPAVYRLADDHVIKHLDLENPGSFVEPASQTKNSFARTRVAGHVACAIAGGTAPAGPAPQDARYPQSTRLRGYGSDISRGLYALADTWDGGHAGPTSFFTKLCGIRQKPKILHSDFGSKVSGEGLIRSPVG